jgi:hypothetical protein
VKQKKKKGTSDYLNTGWMTARMFPKEARPTSSRRQFSAKVAGSMFWCSASDSACSSGCIPGLLPPLEEKVFALMAANE